MNRWIQSSGCETNDEEAACGRWDFGRCSLWWSEWWLQVSLPGRYLLGSHKRSINRQLRFPNSARPEIPASSHRPRRGLSSTLKPRTPAETPSLALVTCNRDVPSSFLDSNRRNVYFNSKRLRKLSFQTLQHSLTGYVRTLCSFNSHFMLRFSSRSTWVGLCNFQIKRRR